jgi:hypothetical protein
MALATEVLRSSSDIAASRLRRGWPVRRLLLVGTIACAGLLSGCGLDLIYVDWKLNKLCAQDGGVKVFITDKPPEYLKLPDGNVDLAMLQGAKQGQPYYLQHKTNMLEVLGSEIQRTETKLIRHVDAETLGISIMYVRPGENVGVPILYRRGYSCPSEGGLLQLVSETFYSSSYVK